MVSPLLAAAISALREPAEPSSRLFVTVSVPGRKRSSSTSSCGRKRGGFRLPAFDFRKPLPIADCRLPIADASQDKNDMIFLLSEAGLRYNADALYPGAQSERQGLAGPVRDLLGGETSPAAFVFQPDCHRLFRFSTQCVKRNQASSAKSEKTEGSAIWRRDRRTEFIPFDLFAPTSGQLSFAVLVFRRPKSFFTQFAPAVGFAGIALGGIELDDAVQGCRRASLAFGVHSSHVPQEDLAAADQQRLCIRTLLLTLQGRPQQTFPAVTPEELGLLRLVYRHAFAQRRFRLGILLEAKATLTEPIH